MYVSLTGHNRGYQVSSADAAAFFVTGFSGVPYAKRHWELAGMAHKVIAMVEFFPILGGVVALMERIAVSFFQKPFVDNPWREQPLSIQHAMREMKANLTEANEKYLNTRGFADPADIQFSDDTLKEPLSFTHHAAERQGKRPTMEDAHFYKEFDKGILSGIFDGHGGREVASYASKEIEKRFPEALRISDGNIQQAFELLIHQIHCEVVKDPNWNTQGSTAVICYIDKATNIAYTATVGDSEAHLYRKTGFWGTRKAIALSLVEDWLSPKALKRLANFHELREAVIQQLFCGRAKELRSYIFGGVNTSSAIGDVDNTGTVSKPLMIHRPMVTMKELKKKDIVILACDGLWDDGNKEEIGSIVARNAGTTNNLAKILVDYAIDEKGSTDNVSVITIELA